MSGPFLAVIEFEYYVIPKEIRVYETYNPGALVRIWAYNITERWEVLWEGRPEMCSPCARIFSPPLSATNWPTK
jgi:F-box and leucine-rich repeat protein 4